MVRHPASSSYPGVSMGVRVRGYAKLSGLCCKSLISKHLQNRRVDEARKVFDSIHRPNIGLFTMMVTGYTRNHRLDEAYELFDEMPARDAVSWNSMMKGSLDCGDLKLAKKVFDEMPLRTVVSWTTMVHGLMKFGRVGPAESLFRAMPEKDSAAWNSMIHGYFSNGRVEKAVALFKEIPCRNVISWTSMISGLFQNGRNSEALLLFTRMVSSGFKPSSPTLVCAVTASANLSYLRFGIEIHGQITKLGFLFDEFISASLITLYSNCELVESARKIFEEKLYNNVAVWTALITGYSSNFEPEKALSVHADMIAHGVVPNQSCFTSALNAACALEALDQGKIIHSRAIKLGLETDGFVGNSLVVMYSKCGNISNGISVFRTISEKNIVSWNSVIVGCAQNGRGVSALSLFGSMTRSGVDPDEITFTGLLSACSHSGNLRKGRAIFKFIARSESLEITQEHNSCMVDLLARCGRLEEAEEFIINTSLEADSKLWLSLLSSACRAHSNLDVAERAAKRVFEIDPSCSAAYVLMSSAYASANRWSDASRVRVAMRRNGVTKQPGSSWVTNHDRYKGEL